MFIGHFAVGFGAKEITPKLSLGWLFIAAQFLDLLWPTLLMMDVEHVSINNNPGKSIPLYFTYYPISHSLFMALVWTLLFGIISWLITRKLKYALVLALCVFSHWILDLFVHYPDLPLYFGNSTKVGLSLWSYPVIEDILEIAMLVIGIIFYLKATTAKNNYGKIVLWILIALLFLSFSANIFGPPPPDINAIAWAGQLQWIFVALAFWADHNRSAERTYSQTALVD